MGRRVLFCLLVITVAAAATATKTDESKVKPIKFPINSEGIRREPQQNADGQKTFERIVEDAVENLIPIQSETQKSAEAEESDETDNADRFEYPLVDFLNLLFNTDSPLHTTTPPATTTTTKQSETTTERKISKLEWLRLALDHRNILAHGFDALEEITTTTTPKPTTAKWMTAEQEFAAEWLGAAILDAVAKEDPHKVENTKIHWQKIFSPPVENSKQFIPEDNGVQWSSAEVAVDSVPSSRTDRPSAIAKHKEQWYGEEEM